MCKHLLSLELIKTVEAPAPINSASLHPDKDFFVAGGEDFKLYKFDYSTKEELGEEVNLTLSNNAVTAAASPEDELVDAVSIWPKLQL